MRLACAGFKFQASWLVVTGNREAIPGQKLSSVKLNALCSNDGQPVAS